MEPKVVGAPLTDKEIAWNLEITLDRQANRSMLQAAMLNFKNSENTLAKRQNEFWKEVLLVRGVDPTKVQAKLSNVRGQTVILEVEEI